MRSVTGPERYGLNSNSPADKEYVRLHNLFARRCAYAFEVMVTLHRLAVLEQPALRDNEISMLNLDEFIKNLAIPGVIHTVRPQCPFGATAFKGTSWVTFNISFEDMNTQCGHLLKNWYRQGDAQ